MPMSPALKFPWRGDKDLLKIWIFLSLLFFLALSNFAWAESVEDNSCITCHSDIWEGMKGSVHAQQNIFCQDCHGGDSTKLDFEAAKAPGTGFIGVPGKKQIAETCGGCHANVEAMNFYGIRTDQLARYKTSGHGKKLFGEGNSQVAACSDCHSHHNILPIADPNSPVYPLNIPKTCNRCHGDEKLMAGYGLPADIFKTYAASVHGKALFEKKDLSVANCTSCHGSHGAVPPGVRDIGAACGKCHINEKKYFLESVHAKATEQGKFSECISCHGNHGVQPASKGLYREACIKCHAPGSSATLEGEKILQVLGKSEGELKTAEALVKQASIEGIFVEEEQGSLEEAKTNVISMAPLQHSLSSARISELYDKFVEVAQEIKTRVHEKRQTLKWRKIALIPIWIFIIIMVSALWIKYKQLKKH
ncbi:MAG: cytochrome c3 family protein [Candidatus Omnitrophica bacterium]|nr:cytochrome c3 family protein [Candidatus Omnitrophota bacterium]